ncbi:ESX secretion-associated protein EspG [Actinokineospora iranica]|uniref:EspG family protein n=1 Tax=Actinokineospora iranica TaxID=1271860 RepID=A0A1G6RG02_9PSEU|nr:ESX secretion-associated protein EspG [Actinokineospora iranica]SDD03371.1 EspG family protein [Actinokineospora iranica]
MIHTTQLGWTLTPDEFADVWDRLDVDGFPYPIRVERADPDISRVRKRLRAARVLGRADRMDPELETALRMLHTPQMSVDSIWLAEDGSDSPHRVLAARAGKAAVIATQEPGPSEHAGGDVLIRDLAPTALAASVVHELPADRPGRAPGGSWVGADADRAEALRDLLAARRLRAGQLGVTAHGTRGPLLFWFDVAGDGRYALLRAMGLDGRPWVRLAPADTAVLRELLARILRQTAGHGG